jgi:hypothetical protein
MNPHQRGRVQDQAQEILDEPKWRNRQTRRTQNPFPQKGVWVQLPPSAQSFERNGGNAHKGAITCAVAAPAAGPSELGETTLAGSLGLCDGVESPPNTEQVAHRFGRQLRGVVRHHDRLPRTADGVDQMRNGAESVVDRRPALAEMAADAVPDVTCAHGPRSVPAAQGQAPPGLPVDLAEDRRRRCGHLRCDLAPGPGRREGWRKLLCGTCGGATWTRKHNDGEAGWGTPSQEDAARAA